MMKINLPLLLLCTLFGFTSCIDTFYATKKTTFDNAIKSIQSQNLEQGFVPNGTYTSTRNETTVEGVSYTKNAGFGTAMSNKYITQDTYRFADSLGNSMSYSVSYQAKQTSKCESYVENIELCGCETSNPKDFDRFCGDDSSIKQINNLPKDQAYRKVNILTTSLAFLGLTAFVTLVLLSFLN